MSQRDQVERLLLVIAVACAVLSTYTLMRRSGDTPAAGQQQYIDTVRVAPTEIGDDGFRIGTLGAQVRILEFTDFECPFCRRFALETRPAMLTRFHGQISFEVHHWPLRNHRFAYPAARAAECAREQSRFHEYSDALFRIQDSIGLIPFEAIAKRTAVPDLDRFRACTNRTEPVPVIESGIARAERLGGRGTPLIVVNNLVYRSGLDSSGLVTAIERALQELTPRNPGARRE